MEKVLESAVVQVPNLVVLGVIVIMFLKQIGKRDEMMKDINRENIEARERSRLVIEKNTEAATSNTGAMNSMTVALQDFIHSTHRR